VIKTALFPIYIETALLGMGLPSLSNDEIAEQWSHLRAELAPELRSDLDRQVNFVWMQQGTVVEGDLNSFLGIRHNPRMQRIDGKQLTISPTTDHGFLTASAVMRFSANSTGICVTAGMGGIRGAAKSDDLCCLTALPVCLIASAPKDVLDLFATLEYLTSQGVSVNGWQTNKCNGFLFEQAAAEVLPWDSNSAWHEETAPRGTLVLNPVPASDRLAGREILQQALSRGIDAERQGRLFHPAVNKGLDELTKGAASRLQFKALLQNLAVALQIRRQWQAD